MPDAVELLKQNLTIDPAYPLYYAWLDKASALSASHQYQDDLH
jgi:hypothetical protein